MDSESECAAAVIIVAAISKKRKRIRKKRLRSIWVKPWLGRRNDLGVDNTLLREFRLEDSDEYKKFLRMSPENFDELLGLVELDIQKKTPRCAKPYPQEKRVYLKKYFQEIVESSSVR